MVASGSPKISSFQDLLNLLNQDGVMHQNQPGEKSVAIPTERGELDSILILRWQDEDGVLQFIQALGLEVPEARIPALESAIVRLNHALAVPGFDLNHQSRTLAYRLFLPIYPRGYLHPEEIRTVFTLTVKTAADFRRTLQRIIQAESEPETVVADAQRDFAAAYPPS